MKIQKTVTLDFDLWKEAKDRNLNISRICNDGLYNALNHSKLKDMTIDQLKKVLEIEQKRKNLKKELEALPEI